MNGKPMREANNQNKPRLVLIAEDSHLNQELLALIVENLGCQTICVGNGIDALRAFESKKIDLVLLDLHMPLMDGFETAEKIRTIDQDRGVQTPIIAVSGISGDEGSLRAQDLKIAAWVEKPFDRQSLSRLVLELMENPERPKLAEAS